MFNYVILSLLFLATIYSHWLNLKALGQKSRKSLTRLEEELDLLKVSFTKLIKQISQREEKAHNILKLYEINRRLSMILDIEELLNVFLEELKRINEVKEAFFSQKSPDNEDHLCFSIIVEGRLQYLSIKCDEEDLRKQLPYLISQLKLLIDRANIYKKLQKISITDSLTTIANRTYFLERYEEEFNRSERFELNISFLMVDIDHFKNYNDRFGHLVGDVILREVSRALRDNIREIDFIGRFGGEEFSIFLPQTSKEEAIGAAERLRQNLANAEFIAYDERIKLTISIGVANFPSNSKDKDLLIEIADRALYKAKQGGRNLVCYF